MNNAQNNNGGFDLDALFNESERCPEEIAHDYLITAVRAEKKLNSIKADMKPLHLGGLGPAKAMKLIPAKNIAEKSFRAARNEYENYTGKKYQIGFYA